MALVMGNLDRDKYDRQYSDAYLIQRLWTYVQPMRRQFIIIALTGIVFSGIQSLIPLLTAWAVEQLEQGDFGLQLVLLVGALLVSSLLLYAVNWVRRRLTSRLVGQLVADLRHDGIKAALRRDLSFYDENKTGKVLSRITSDTEDFGQILVITSDIFSQLLQVFVLSAVLFYYSVPLTLIVLGTLIPMIIATEILRKQARKVTRQGARAMATVNDNIQETVTGISVAKNFRQEAMIYQAFEAVNQQSYRVNLRRGLVLSLVFPVLNVLAGIVTGIIVYVGAIGVVDGVISVGVWFLYLQATERFWFPIIQLSSYWSQFQQAISAIERVFALIDAENTVQQQGQLPADNIRGAVTFDHVQFAYVPNQPVLKDFSLDVAAGETVAFVGHTGAGKSSIMKLLMRFYEFQGGRILIDGQDIRQFDLKSFRRRIGFVPQSPFLFSGTIADNIRYARPDATDDEIEAIAHAIGNGEWLETLPNGLASDVGERGSRLSIGQRQLVSLLRVLIQRPSIFILDEATASIDQFTELQIQEALNMILAQSTAFLIAHRLSTVRSADRIIVLRQGEIIEQGNHEQLMEQGGHYAELYNTYFRHQSLSYVESARSMLATGD